MRTIAMATLAAGLAVGVAAHPAFHEATAGKASTVATSRAVLPAPDLFGAMLVVR